MLPVLAITTVADTPPTVTAIIAAKAAAVVEAPHDIFLDVVPKSV